MKLNTNFINPTLIVTPVVGLMLWGLSFLLISVSMVLIIDRQQMNADITTLQSENELLSQQANSYYLKNKKELPSQQELQQLVKKVSALNAVSGVQGVSVAVLLERLELALPKDTFLKSMEHYPEKGEVLLTAVSAKNSLLTDFLRLLERDKHFAKVMLLRQLKNEDQKDIVQFDVRLVLAQ